METGAWIGAAPISIPIWLDTPETLQVPPTVKGLGRVMRPASFHASMVTESVAPDGSRTSAEVFATGVQVALELAN